MSTRVWEKGGYRYVPGVFQYSAGVAALPGYAIERVLLPSPTPWREAFPQVATYLRDRGRPLTAFCACEMRSPKPFTESGFKSFNEAYAQMLADWGLLEGGDNPVARSNVCPAYDPPSEPCLYAFAFTTPAVDEPASFIVAGGAEAPEGRDSYADHIVARGDLSASGLKAKATFVMDEMLRRLEALGFDWSSTTTVQAYSVHNIHPLLAELLASRGAARHGITWHYARPPIVDLEYEMDCRGLNVERLMADQRA